MTTGSTVRATTKNIDATNAKMVQLALNLLGYDAGKVDGKLGGTTKTALSKFQTSVNIDSTGDVDGQTCLKLAQKIIGTYPTDENAKELHDNLLRLYLKIGAPQK